MRSLLLLLVLIAAINAAAVDRYGIFRKREVDEKDEDLEQADIAEYKKEDSQLDQGPSSEEAPPSGEDKKPPPSKEKKPPATKENPPPPKDKKPPASKENPPPPKDKKPPASKENPPAAKEKKPPASKENPSPPKDKTPPASKENPPASKEKKPPASKENPPPPKDKKPPASKENPPASKEKKPPASKEKPPKGSKEQKPPASKERPPNGSKEKKPPASKERPPKGSKEQKPPASKERPPNGSKEKKPPASKERPPKGSKEQWTSREEPPKVQHVSTKAPSKATQPPPASTTTSKSTATTGAVRPRPSTPEIFKVTQTPGTRPDLKTPAFVSSTFPPIKEKTTVTPSKATQPPPASTPTSKSTATTGAERPRPSTPEIFKVTQTPSTKPELKTPVFVPTLPPIEEKTTVTSPKATKPARVSTPQTAATTTTEAGRPGPSTPAVLKVTETPSKVQEEKLPGFVSPTLPPIEEKTTVIPAKATKPARVTTPKTKATTTAGAERPVPSSTQATHEVTQTPSTRSELKTPAFVSPTVPPIQEKTTVNQTGCDFCSKSCYTFRLIPGADCSQYVEERAGYDPLYLSCPNGLVLDTRLCMCNYRQHTKCGCHPDAPLPSPSSTTAAVQVESTEKPVTTAKPAIFEDGSTCGACARGGVTYRTARGYGCSAFTEETPGAKPKLSKCAEGLLFDAMQCTCNLHFFVKCPVQCGNFLLPPVTPAAVRSTPTPAAPTTPGISSTKSPVVGTEVVATKPSIIGTTPSTTLDTFIKVTSGCGSCQAGGNTYRTVAGTGCKSFTEEAPGIVARKYECPGDLIFDTNHCVCNWKDEVQCRGKCDGGNPPIIHTEIATPKPPVVGTQPPFHPETFIKVTTGCGSCQAGGNVYHVIAGSGCRQFTEAAPGIAPRQFSCPGGLIFDSTLCVCNYDYAVTCSPQCGPVPQQPSVVVTARPPIDITARPPVIPDNDVFKGEIERVVSGCGSCQAGGNTYRTVAGTGCTSFTEEAPGITPKKYNCPGDLIFDTNLCVCNWRDTVQCSAKCDGGNPPVIHTEVATPKPPAVGTQPPFHPDTFIKVISGCGSCQAGGNIYRTVAGSDCAAFTEEAPGIAPKKYDCPGHLIFDTNLCVCNWKDAVQCSAKCDGGNPPIIHTELVTPKPPAVETRPPLNPDGFFKVTTGCGSCQAEGNVYHVIAGSGCRHFTEAAPGIAARQFSCPAGLIFDSTLCVCNYDYAVTCSSQCGSAPKLPTPAVPVVTARPPVDITARPPIVPDKDESIKVTSGCGSCEAGGNTYRTVAGSGCSAFTEEAPGIVARKHTCADNLIFDTNLCVCNWRDVVQCSERCDGAPPATEHTEIQTARPTAVVTAPPTHHNNDAFIKVTAGCGVCQVGGNTYRTVDGTQCTAFTVEARGIAPTYHTCPDGLIFDTNGCTCGWRDAVQCSSTCSGSPPAPNVPVVTAPPAIKDVVTTGAPGCGVCKTGCTTFRVLEDGGSCNAFIEDTEGATPVRRTCPAGLSFDASLCMCSWKDATKCTCGARQSHPALTPPPKVPIAPCPNEHLSNSLSPAKVEILKTIPAGCGTCEASGIIFRTVPETGCVGFTKETAFLPAVRFDCNAGLAFDVSVCQCLRKESVSCKCAGEKEP